ncbi:Lrp/AsnC family transcriptional regulator [Neptunomonas phycophila]|uniref:Lrp/AsnC family transcriptional regulator n=1 Tax=Neptunomonas phycophila TaxID=1572645 RepID=A0AAW7XF65_9GAMM|nr:Lrp/AsnC family transcriptional regulator [Neptunomonas phycophila]MDO6452856.1 Lrp/AsnC family transcriptional regulator [Neptunomonas phycophila]
MDIDGLDRKILVHLQRNNRMANVELADRVGLSPPACLKRVKRLREFGVITADVSLLNPKLAGSQMCMIVSIEMERDRGDIYQQFRRSINDAKEVTQCYQVTGEYDFVLIVTVAGIEAFEAFVERVLHADLNIRKFRTAISIRQVKFTTEIAL